MAGREGRSEERTRKGRCRGIRKGKREEGKGMEGDEREWLNCAPAKNFAGAYDFRYRSVQ